MIELDEHLAIKKFSLGNLKQVFELGLDTYGEEETTPLESLESLAELAFGDDGYYFGVIEFNYEFVGYLCMYEKSSTALSIGDIVIINEYRGKRIAQRSISSFLDEIFKVKFYQKVELTVRKSNFSAIKCYENLNFKAVEIQSEYYLDKEDAHKMVYIPPLGID
jgi:ribosomal protein S18 acetylase RimI-like enzyme